MIWDAKGYWEEGEILVLVLKSMNMRSLVDDGTDIGVVALNSTCHHKGLVLDWTHTRSLAGDGTEIE